ncbi:hypothetical protein Q1695_013865 [Nippostrongylus brasiliensis]|nr:hypothetical protein Q1695_013865 [Nippostrongylus brasiliensis]
MLVVHLKLLALVCIVELNVVCGLKCAYMMDGRYVDFENTVCATAVEYQCLPSSVHFQAVPRAQISPLIKPSGCKNPTEDGREITCFCDTDHCNRNFTRLLAELESKNILGQDPGRLLKCFKRLKKKYGDEGARSSEVFPLTENDKKAHESGSRLAKRSGSLIAENPGQSHVEKREMPEKSSLPKRKERLFRRQIFPIDILPTIV